MANKHISHRKSSVSVNNYVSKTDSSVILNSSQYEALSASEKENYVLKVGPKLPEPTDIMYGEIAVNYKDDCETLSIKNDNDEIVEFASKKYLSELVPTPTSLETEKFLKGDGTWDTPAAATYPKGTEEDLNTGTDTTEKVWDAKTLSDYVTSSTASATKFKGEFNAATGTIDGGSSTLTSVSEKIGDMYTATTAGTFVGTAMEVGDSIIFRKDVAKNTAPTANDVVFVEGTVSVTNTGNTLEWNTDVTVATVEGVNITAKLPANPNTDTKVTSVENHYTPTGTDTKSASGATGTAGETVQVVTGVTVDAKGHVTGVVSGAATDTDTKVTSAANHYTPATASGQDKSASASGATAAWSIDVVKGVTLNTDGKGHVTGLSVTSGKIPANPVSSTTVTGSGLTADKIVVGNGNSTVKTSSKGITTTAPSSSSDDTTVPTSKAVWTAVSNGIATADAMIYKGTVAGGSTGAYGALTPAASKGWTYKVTTAGKIDGKAVEVGDMLICNTDGTEAATSSNYSTIVTNWDFIQVNIDGAVTGPASSTDAHVVTFNGATGKVVKDSGFTIAASVPSDAVFTDTKVTSVGYHYTPTGTETKSASGATGTAGATVQVVTGVTVDAAGHVTGVVSGAATDTTYQSKAAASGGTDVSLATTGEKYTWNNKQDKVGKLGSTTKPVYTSAAGTFYECSTYAGGTAVTLNGTSKAASTASFYAPATPGTSGQMLVSNGSGAPSWDDVYAANLTVKSAADYISEPEIKSVKINGSSTNAASTKNCQITYDTTNNCLKFIFN